MSFDKKVKIDRTMNIKNKNVRFDNEPVENEYLVKGPSKKSRNILKKGRTIMLTSVSGKVRIMHDLGELGY